MKYEIIIPTYRRVEKLERLLGSIRNTASERISDISVFVQFDNNDTQSFKEFMEYSPDRTIAVNRSINTDHKLFLEYGTTIYEVIFMATLL